LDTPVLHWFDAAKVRHVDERKRRLTLRHVLTMTTGLEWNENVPYDDPRSDSSLMEATDDWVRYVIDKPMAEEPGRRFNYSSGATELLAEIFRRETGQDIEAYGRRHLFEPLGIRYHWKRTYLGLVDTEGGLYLSGPDLAKIGLLYLRGGEWEGRQVVPADWVHQSVAPFIAAGDDGEPFQYGFKWWLYKRPDNGRIVWMARGFGGQRLMVFPEEGLIATFTGWEIIKDPPPTSELVGRLVRALAAPICPGTAH
ncbi:MAG: serine hydrolase, partial [Proteobacteria bacterium]|nr:serine hydrolase [Pseudomonadota bacterium]